MKRRIGRLRRRVYDFSLPVCMIATLAALVTGPLGEDIGHWVARPALLIFLLVQWPRQKTMARTLQLIGLAICVAIAVLHRDPLPILLHALDRFCFFATFVTSLGLLRVSAMRSRLVRQAGQVLIRQKPAWRYPTLSLGAAVFGMIVNIGVLNLFGTMVQRSNSLKAAGGNVRIQKVRERRMILAILRGFALAPLVSPLGISLAVILSNMPQLQWSDIAPLAFPTAGVVFLLGWGLDWLMRPRNLKAPPQPPVSMAPLARFSLLAMAIAGAVFAVRFGFDVRLPVAVLIACPLSAFTWLALQRRRLGGGTGAIRAVTMVGRHARLIFGANRNEIAVLGGSAFIGALVMPLIDRQALAQALLASGLHGLAAAIAAFMVVLVLAQLGLNPIVTVTLLAGLFPDTHVIGLPPVILAVSLMSAWSLSMISSPFTASMMILSQLLERSPFRIAWGWDGLFFGVLIPVIVGWVCLLAWVVG